MSLLTNEAQAALEFVRTPMWILDCRNRELSWANRSALAFFGAPDLEAASAKALACAGEELLANLRHLGDGVSVSGEWELSSAGHRPRRRCIFTGVGTDSMHRFVLVEAAPELAALSLLPAAEATAERRELELKLQGSDRMASIGVLAAGVAHGINNPLAYVIANLEYVKKLLAGPARIDARALTELSDVVDDSLDGADRVRRIVSDLGVLSRPDDERVVAVDLERIAERALGMATNEIRHRARVVREFSKVPAAAGTELKLVEVVLNILINAAHAVEPGAIEKNTIWVRTNIDYGRPRLEIEDTGCGIAEAHLRRVFDPFFTTKPVGVGTGLGLSIARRIIKDFGGDIHVESKLGKGTKVSITLPRSAGVPAPSEPVMSVPPLSTTEVRARILIVDDEPGILRALKRVLGPHEVVGVLSGQEAIQAIERDKPFDVIFCDVMMPEMSGVEVYQRIAEIHPGQERRVVFMTGGAFAEPAAQFLESVQNPTIAKPFQGAVVRSLVASMAVR